MIVFAYNTTLIKAVIYLHMLILQSGAANITQIHYIYEPAHVAIIPQKNLLFTPALYKCKPEEVAMVILVFAGANRTSPSATVSSADVVIVPSPPMTTKMDGPGEEG